MRSLVILFLTAVPAVAQNTAGWGNTAAPEDKGFSWTDPLWAPFWMAWTPATLAVFIGIFSAMIVLTIAELRRPGGDARHGALGLVTTRGDRLFLSLLGTAFIFLGWLAVMGQPVWGALAISVCWTIFCFWKV